MQHHKQVVGVGVWGRQRICNYHSRNCFVESFSHECAYLFSCGVSTGLEGNPLASSKNISFHSESNGGLIEYSATNVVATRCLSHPHVFLKPPLMDENKISRMELALSFINKNNTSKFENTEDLIHIDEKWFYLMKDGQRFIIAADEDEPYRHDQHKL